jgi:hypothetical protein
MKNLVSFGEFSTGMEESKLPGPKTYYAGLSKSTKKKRAAQIKKQTKMSDDDPQAYKPLPGDSKKTKTSKFTKKFQTMFGDNISEEREGEMYKPRLEEIIHYAQDLLSKMRDGAELPAWIQDKITLSHHNMEAASLNYYEEKHHEDDDHDDDDDEEREEEFGDDKDTHFDNTGDYVTEPTVDKETDDILLDEGAIKNQAIETGLNNKLEAVRKKGMKGVTLGILREVMRRGMAAWKTGHRPGAGQEQWGYARVNSFLTGGPTVKGADKDLAKKAGII